ncbi:MAG: hypothetical protein LBG78_00495 [Azoarcus sp.]|jgi:hypothetical protein|nr:hypothetical protein [Azoarcus sp.]
MGCCGVTLLRPVLFFARCIGQALAFVSRLRQKKPPPPSQDRLDSGTDPGITPGNNLPPTQKMNDVAEKPAPLHSKNRSISSL